MSGIESSARWCCGKSDEPTAEVLGEVSRIAFRVLESFAAGAGDVPWHTRSLLTEFPGGFCTLASVIAIESFRRVGVDGWILVEGEDPIERRRHSWVEKECAGGAFVIDLTAHQFAESRAGFGR